jgi:Zn finger protein HypA/HybF involved in hydrogenase expression
MSICPKCHEEVEPGFEVCWNCNYSFTEEQIIQFKELSPEGKAIDCLRCQVRMNYTGNYKFHEGPHLGYWGNFFEAFENKESFDLYVCPKCGKVEFFMPMKSV